MQRPTTSKRAPRSAFMDRIQEMVDGINNATPAEKVTPKTA
jgi:hypothetical protein